MPQRPKDPRATTGRGIFRFPALVKPDTKWKAEGDYHVDFLTPDGGEEHNRLVSLIRPVHDEAIRLGQIGFDELPIAQRKKLKELTVNTFGDIVYDKDSEEPTGDVVFKFKRLASGVVKKTGKKWSATVNLFDARGKAIVTRKPDGTLIEPALEIWGGTVGKVSFEYSPYFIPGTGTAGVSLRLVGAQIIELRAGGQQSAADMGFGAEEDGYEYEAATPGADATDSEEAAGEDGGGDF